MIEVYEDVFRTGVSESISVDSCAGRSRQFRQNIFTGKFHRIVAAGRLLPRVREVMRLQENRIPSVFRCASGLYFRLCRIRGNQDVEQVGTPCSAEMSMGKPDDGVVIIMIARAGIPAFSSRIGTELDHSERDSGARIGVSVESGSDHRVDIIGRSTGVLASIQECGCRHQKKYPFHKFCG